MFLTNLEKCLKIFDRVYVSSDSDEILDVARTAGAFAILRDKGLCGDTPDIPVFQHALSMMDRSNYPKVDAIVAVHSDTPLIEPALICLSKRLIEWGAEEVMTAHKMKGAKKYKDQSSPIYGSIRAMTRNRLISYPKIYEPDPDVLLVDTSPEIETPADYKELLENDN